MTRTQELLRKYAKELGIRNEEIQAGRILRGHTKKDCLCRFCKTTEANRQELTSPREDRSDER